MGSNARNKIAAPTSVPDPFVSSGLIQLTLRIIEDTTLYFKAQEIILADAKKAMAKLITDTIASNAAHKPLTLKRKRGVDEDLLFPKMARKPIEPAKIVSYESFHTYETCRVSYQDQLITKAGLRTISSWP
jgi:hypothetical protein